MGIAEEEPVRRAVRGWLRAGRTQAMAQAPQSSFYSPTPRGWTWHGPVVPPTVSPPSGFQIPWFRSRKKCSHTVQSPLFTSRTCSHA